MKDDVLDDNVTTNPTNNRTFNEVLNARISRRDVLKGSLGFAVASFFSAPSLADSFANLRTGSGPAIDFTPVPLADGNGAEPVISVDYQYDVRA